jgi:hypothetical protein
MKAAFKEMNIRIHVFEKAKLCGRQDLFGGQLKLRVGKLEHAGKGKRELDGVE